MDHDATINDTKTALTAVAIDLGEPLRAVVNGFDCGDPPLTFHFLFYLNPLTLYHPPSLSKTAVNKHSNLSLLPPFWAQIPSKFLHFYPISPLFPRFPLFSHKFPLLLLSLITLSSPSTLLHYYHSLLLQPSYFSLTFTRSTLHYHKIASIAPFFSLSYTVSSKVEDFSFINLKTFHGNQKEA